MLAALNATVVREDKNGTLSVNTSMRPLSCRLRAATTMLLGRLLPYGLGVLCARPCSPSCDRAFIVVRHGRRGGGAGLAMVATLIVGVRAWWARAARRRGQIEHFMRLVIEQLQLQAQCNPPYAAIPHIRDSIIEGKDRYRHRDTWNAVVSELEHDSRILKMQKTINGVHYPVWQWNGGPRRGCACQYACAARLRDHLTVCPAPRHAAPLVALRPVSPMPARLYPDLASL